MTVTCTICERIFDVDIDEYLEIDDDYICDECADYLIEMVGDWYNEMELRKN